MPVVEIVVIARSPLEDDVRVFGLGWELAHRFIVPAFPVLGDVNGGIKSTGLLKASPQNTVHLHQKITSKIRIRYLSCLSHDSLLLLLTFRDLSAAVPE